MIFCLFFAYLTSLTYLWCLRSWLLALGSWLLAFCLLPFAFCLGLRGRSPKAALLVHLSNEINRMSRLRGTTVLRVQSEDLLVLFSPY